IPWTAVNLVDYYFIRKGHYAIAEIFKPNGIYGRWGWRGITAYLVGFLVMMPFFSVSGLFVGWVAHAMDGADLSFFVGLTVAGVLYWALCRNLDVEAEERVARAEQRELEAAASAHDLP
ncbi:MAG: cytosine permease, partial [Marmoricola sp.]